MISPVTSPKITSPYGVRPDPSGNGHTQFHDGIDFIDKNDNREVMAISSGIVCFDFDGYDEKQRWVSPVHSAGNYIIIKHIIAESFYYCRYLHLGKNFVSLNKEVAEGDIIGIYADAGISYGSHLHFDMYDVNWKKIDPTSILLEVLI
jgi:murein DD-endopeptidase MepM/ murein hydrolase activator NlpD